MAKKDTPSQEERTYGQALDELQALLKKLESGELDIDRMVDEVKQASRLIKFCKEKLYAIEKEVNTIMDCSDKT